jgi:hypothetical protein
VHEHERFWNTAIWENRTEKALDEEAYYKGARDGQNIAKEREAEALKEKAISELALGHLQKKSN